MSDQTLDQAYDEATATILASVREEVGEITAAAAAITATAKGQEEQSALAQLRAKLFGTRP